MEKHSLLLGAHVSIAGGLQNAFERGQSIGCTAIQIFTKSNRQWRAKPITQHEIALFNEARRQSSIKAVVVHAAYLINVASAKKDIYQKSLNALRDELKRVELLGLPCLVFHPGSRLDLPLETALKQVAEACNTVLDTVPGQSKLLIETMAGQGSSVGSTLEEISTIIKLVKNKRRIGVCIDTCHIFASGYDITTPKKYEAFWKEFDALIGMEKLQAIHLNDSKKGLGAHVDRHEFIGEGKIGLNSFRYLMNDPQLFDVPKILETPVLALEQYAQDIEKLKKLISPETKRLLGS